MKLKQNKNLPVFGVGPFYVAIIIVITLFAIIVNKVGFFSNFRFSKFRVAVNILGILIIILGLIIWIGAVIISKIDKNIKDNNLVVDGIYKYVRNPIYSAFLFVSSGILLFTHNLLFLILPIVYWIILTQLMIHTEEKWLFTKYGDKYEDYCKKTNRCIPFFPRK